MHDISAYIQCYSNKRAVFECIKSFRNFYPTNFITLVSDNGDDFTSISNYFNLNYIYSDKNILPKGRMCGLECVYEYFKRIYNHCISTESEWVVLLEEDVNTLRKIKHFPSTDAGGARIINYNQPLTDFLNLKFKNGPYGYGMCGGSIFKRKSYINAYELNKNLEYYLTLDNRLDSWSDIPLTLLFHINGYSYSVWDEISELHHICPELRIIKDSAFDHAYKFWYGKDFNDNLMETT